MSCTHIKKVSLCLVSQVMLRSSTSRLVSNSLAKSHVLCHTTLSLSQAYSCSDRYTAPVPIPGTCPSLTQTIMQPLAAQHPSSWSPFRQMVLGWHYYVMDFLSLAALAWSYINKLQPSLSPFIRDLGLDQRCHCIACVTAIPIFRNPLLSCIGYGWPAFVLVTCSSI